MLASSLGRADLHVHPAGNRKTGGDPKAFFGALLAARLDLVALTDHDRIDLAVAVAALGADVGLDIVVGEEVETREGHLLGLGLRTRVAPGRRLGDTVAEIHAQGGLAIVPHPLLPVPLSASRSILEALARGVLERRPDAVESVNARAPWLPGYRRRVARFAAGAGYAVVGGSDAHRPADVGRGLTRFRGHTLEDLARAIAACETTTEGRPFGIRDLLPRVGAD